MDHNDVLLPADTKELARIDKNEIFQIPSEELDDTQSKLTPSSQ